MTSVEMELRDEIQRDMNWERFEQHRDRVRAIEHRQAERRKRSNARFDEEVRNQQWGALAQLKTNNG